MASTTAYSIAFNGIDTYASAPSVSAYDFGVADFTVEAWVLTTAGGPVATQMGSDATLGAGWGLFVEADGNISFQTFDKTGAVMNAITQSAPRTFDGSWHHIAAVREGVELRIFFDGVPQLLNVDITGAPPLNVTGNLPLTLGATALVGGQTHRQMFAGEVDEFRLWNTAVPQWLIVQNIYHIVTRERDHLVAQYGFDQKTGVDTSGKGNDLTMNGPVQYMDPAFYFVPEGQPFMAVQVRMMEDYQYSKANISVAPTPVKALRVSLSPRESDGQLRAATLTISGDEKFSFYTEGKTYQCGPSKPVTLKTNEAKYLNLSVNLDADTLTAPVLKVHADFMGADERIVVPLDRQVHHSLSVTTGPELTAGASPVLDPAQFTPAEAEGVARTVRNVMSAAVQHDMQPANPIVRSAGAPHQAFSMLTARRAVSRGSPGLPERENYLPIEMENPVVVTTSDLMKCHYMAQNEPVERVVIPGFMQDPHFSFDVKTKTFTPMTHAQAAAALETRRAHPNAVLSSDAASLSTVSSLWDLFWQGVLDVVDIVVSIGSAIVNGVSVAITYIENGVTKVFDFIVATVTEAAKFIVGLFKALKVAIDKVIDFLSALFDWGDILLTHRVVRKFMDQSIDFGEAVLNDLKTSASKMFDDAKTSIDTYFDRAIASLGQKTAAERAEGANLDQPASLQSDYVRQHVAEGDLKTQPTTSSTPSDSALQNAMTSITTGSSPYSATITSSQQTGVTSFISDASGALNQVIATFLTALKTSLDMAIDLAKAIVDAVMSLVIEGYDLIKAMMTTRINIPIITWLYEDVITNDGSTLTMTDLLALAGAVPVTVLNKLLNGASPFTAAFETQFQTMTWQDYGFYRTPSQTRPPLATAATLGGDPILANLAECPAAKAMQAANSTITWQAVISWIQGFIFAIAVFVWFAYLAQIDAINAGSVLTGAVSTALLFPMVGAEFVAQIMSFPIYETAAEYSAGHPGSLEVSIWALQWIPFAIDVGNIVLSIKKPTAAWASTYVDKVQDIIVGVWGIIHALLFIALAIWEEIANAGDTAITDSERDGNATDIVFKGISNVITTLPEIAGFARAAPPTPQTIAGVTTTDLASGLIAALITTGRTIGSILRQHPMQAR